MVQSTLEKAFLSESSVFSSCACVEVSALAVFVASAEEAQPMLAALRTLPWDARHAVLQALSHVLPRLWMRCVLEMGPDEVLFSSMVSPSVDDSSSPIPLPDIAATPRRHRLRCKTSASS